MTTYTEHKHGTFSWMELATKDAAAAKKFYGGLFGWTFDDMPAGPDMIYSMCKIGDKTVGALYQMGADMAKATPPHWASYVSVTDVDATTKKVAPAGGKVMKEAFDVMDVGRMSVVQDPSGATLCLWQAKKHIGAQLKAQAGTLCWNELMSTNIDRAGKFYSDVLGWKLDPKNMGPAGMYTLFHVEGSDSGVGGMMAMPKDMANVPSNWVTYIAADDVDASSKKVKELGGEVIVPAQDIPNIGRFAIVSDPGGAMFALYKNAH